MKKMFSCFILIVITLLIHSAHLFSQTNTDTLHGYKVLPAGAEYKASGWRRLLWGSNYRDVWTTPVTVKQLWLDTAKGGLTPFKTGGGHQTKSLHFKNAEGKEYSLRSVNKTLGKVLPPVFLNTFIEDEVNDEVSMSNPYAAGVVPYLAEKAGIYHTEPVYVYLPKQPTLKEFNDVYGDNFYLFEQRMEGDWASADNLGNFKNYIETFQLLDTLKQNNSISTDQRIYIKSRLFDMFLNDWDRHEGQWRWGEKKEGDRTLYIPVPQDRDQAFSKHSGLLLSVGMSAGNLDYMQSFKDNLEDVKTFSYEERNLDRRFANETNLNDWQTAAAELQQALTDEVIETAVKNLPAEIHPVIGKDIAEKLKARRNHISEWAKKYYLFLSKEVEIPGTYGKEEFDIESTNDNETRISVYALDDQNIKKSNPFYSRTFNEAETKEIRLFGLAGEDKYILSGNGNNAISVKIISGIHKDSVIATVQQNNSVSIYDDRNNVFKTGKETRLHFSTDTSLYAYKYNWFRYDKRGLSPSIFYSNEDRFYVGLGYKIKNFAWNKNNFASSQLIALHYSLIENAFSISYRALFPEITPQADLKILAIYDAVRWNYFFGLGNETVFADDKNIEYYTTRTKQWIIQPEWIKHFGRSSFTLLANVQGIKIINDTARFVSKVFINNDNDFDWKNFVGAGAVYTYQQLNDSIVPVKGIYFGATVTGAQNLQTSSGYYVKCTGTASFFIPLISKFSLGIRAGASTITGNPEFYQYPSLGGINFRGVKRDRFRGKSVVYNTNDLRFISKVHTKFFSGKAGLFAFFDDGRVWLPSENSNVWHTSYGGGIILSPFNFLYADASYGVSKSEHAFRFRFTYHFRYNNDIAK